MQQQQHDKDDKDDKKAMSVEQYNSLKNLLTPAIPDVFQLVLRHAARKIFTTDVKPQHLSAENIGLFRAIQNDLKNSEQSDIALGDRLMREHENNQRKKKRIKLYIDMFLHRIAATRLGNAEKKKAAQKLVADRFCGGDFELLWTTLETELADKTDQECQERFRKLELEIELGLRPVSSPIPTEK